MGCYHLTLVELFLSCCCSPWAEENHANADANLQSLVDMSNAQCSIAIVSFQSLLGNPSVEGARTNLRRSFVAEGLLKIMLIVLPQYSECCHQASR